MKEDIKKRHFKSNFLSAKKDIFLIKHSVLQTTKSFHFMITLHHQFRKSFRL